MEGFSQGYAPMLPGIRLRITMRIETPVDENWESTSDPSYYIEEVHEVIPPTNQNTDMEMFGEDE